MKAPIRNRRYLHHLLNDTNWDGIEPRASDIIVASSIKAGTTWLQTIVMNLVFQSAPWPNAVMSTAPWVDRFRYDSDLADMHDLLNRQTHRRILKTHLPLDALRFFPQAKYLFIARDPRDIFMSLWNHHQNYTSERIQIHHDIGRHIGMPWPEMPNDQRDFYRIWITKSLFEWETEGCPYWSVFYNFNSWWQFRDLPNLLVIHYDDLLNQTEAEIARIAEFLQISVPQEFWSQLMDNISLESMKNNGPAIMGEAEKSFQGGAKTFINKGTNGRWRSVLNESDVALYEAAANRNLSAQARAWIERG